jgi:hypothetical protein
MPFYEEDFRRRLSSIFHENIKGLYTWNAQRWVSYRGLRPCSSLFKSAAINFIFSVEMVGTPDTYFAMELGIRPASVRLPPPQISLIVDQRDT